MVDGALETLDLTLFKRGMFEFASYVFFDVGWLEMDRFFDFLCFQKKSLVRVIQKNLLGSNRAYIS